MIYTRGIWGFYKIRISSSGIICFANFLYGVCLQTSIMSFEEDNFLRLKVVEYFARDMTGNKKFGFNYEKKNNKIKKSLTNYPYVKYLT